MVCFCCFHGFLTKVFCAGYCWGYGEKVHSDFGLSYLGKGLKGGKLGERGLYINSMYKFKIQKSGEEVRKEEERMHTRTTKPCKPPHQTRKKKSMGMMKSEELGSMHKKYEYGNLYDEEVRHTKSEYAYTDLLYIPISFPRVTPFYSRRLEK